MTAVDTNEGKKFLDYIAISGYEVDASGNLIIKTEMSDECDALIKKADGRNFLSRPVEIKDGEEIVSGYMFSVHEFFTDLIVSEIDTVNNKIDISLIIRASRTYNLQKNIRTIYKWTGNGNNAYNQTPSIVTDVYESVSYSASSVDQNGMLRLRMYRNGAMRLQTMIQTILGKMSKDVKSHIDGNDYLISPEEFDIEMLDEIRQEQEHERRSTYTFTYDQLCENRLVDAIDVGSEIELDIPENCMLTVDSNLYEGAKHICVFKRFEFSEDIQKNTVLMFNSDNSIGAFESFSDKTVTLKYFFDGTDGDYQETRILHKNTFYEKRPSIATNMEINMYNAKLRTFGMKFLPDTREIIPILKSLKPGDTYYCPDFDAVEGKFVVKECNFSGSVKEFTIIIERKLGFNNREKCEELVNLYNNTLNTASEKSEKIFESDLQ